jgi:hypothetical protein
MAKITLNPNDGYTKLGDGPIQIYFHSYYGEVGIIHSDTAPADTDIPDFYIPHSTKIEKTEGTKPCYAKNTSSKAITIAYADI